MPVYGDPVFCKGGCSWHSVTIYQKSHKEIEECGAQVLPMSRVMVNINTIEPHLDITNFKNPWKFGNTSRTISMGDGYGTEAWFIMAESQLVTSSHQLGGIDEEAIDKKLKIHEVQEKLIAHNPNVPGPILRLVWTASAVHPQTQRIYISATETMSKIGGCANALLVSLLLLYGLYHGVLLKKDIIHKGLTLGGKFGLSDSRLGEFADFYGVKNYKLEESQEKNKKEYCCKRKVKPKSDGDGVGPSLEDDRLLDRAFENMMARQLDFKHIMQISQDVEIIKKVLFHKRHILLGPIIAIENEKRALLASCQGGPQEERKTRSPDQVDAICSASRQMADHQMKVEVTPADPLNDS